MLLALSTLGCPQLSLSEAAAMAAAHGYSGLELRSAPNGTVSPAASAEDRRRWRTELSSSGVEALALASYVRVCDREVDDASVLESGVGQLRLAHDLGASWVRVFPGGVRGVPCPPEVEERAGWRLAALASAAAVLGVGLALETHDSHPTARDVMRLLEAAGSTGVAVIWDVLHTWLGAEEPDETVRLLGERLAYVQVKDVASRRDLAPLPLGQGVLPVTRCLELVRDHDLSSWVSWEYERLWHPESAALEELAGPGRHWLEGALTKPS